MMKKSTGLKVLLSAIIVAAGFFGMQAMAALKRPPAKQPPPNPARLVEVLELQPQSREIVIHATGTVQPRKTVDIIPQVSGRVTRVSPNFISGGYFKAGEVWFQIESIDYKLAAEKSQAEVARAEYELAQVQSQARVARAEWERIRLNRKDRPNPLVLYEPQLKNAQAALASAQADLKQRQLEIARTRLTAPFDCRVRSESIEPGQFVAAGQRVGRISGTAVAEVLVPVTLADLQWLSVPRPNQADAQGSAATVQIDVGGQILQWPGVVDRDLGEVDSKGGMMRLVVRVDDPYGLAERKTAVPNIDLSEGLFVDVTLTGRKLNPVFVIPAGAMRQGNQIWTMNADNRLETHPVEIVFRQQTDLFVRGDIHAGDQLVTTYLSGAAPGLKLRLNQEA